MIMLKKFSVENFKGFKDKITFDIGSPGDYNFNSELIENGCDRIAVMNYYRGAEIKNIATEVDLVQKHGKGIITIYELQKADGHGLKEINTYYNSGLAALARSFKSVMEAYPEQTISIAYHDYRALKEVLKR